MRVTWVGHSTVVLELDGGVVVTDPVLGRWVGPLRRRGPAPESDVCAGAQAVLLSHLHHDHANLRSLRSLGDVPVVTAPENAAFLRRRGIAGAHGLADGWHPLPGTALRVRSVRADHRHRPMPHRPNTANGHVLAGPSARVWVVGDTSYYPEMAAVPELAEGPIDLALVPVSGWGPRLSPGHLGPDAAARACALVRPRVAIPVHWGSLHMPGMSRSPPGWMDRPGPAFVKALARHAPECEAVVLRPGESAELPEGDG